MPTTRGRNTPETLRGETKFFDSIDRIIGQLQTDDSTSFLKTLTEVEHAQNSTILNQVLKNINIDNFDSKIPQQHQERAEQAINLIDEGRINIRNFWHLQKTYTEEIVEQYTRAPIASDKRGETLALYAATQAVVEFAKCTPGVTKNDLKDLQIFSNTTKDLFAAQIKKEDLTKKDIKGTVDILVKSSVVAAASLGMVVAGGVTPIIVPAVASIALACAASVTIPTLILVSVAASVSAIAASGVMISAGLAGAVLSTPISKNTKILDKLNPAIDKITDTVWHVIEKERQSEQSTTPGHETKKPTKAISKGQKIKKIVKAQVKSRVEKLTLEKKQREFRRR